MGHTVLHEPALRRLLQSTDGPVGRYIAGKADKVLDAAYGYASGQGSGPQVRTGDLRNNLRAFMRTDGNGAFAVVGTDAGGAIGHRDRNYPVLLELGGVVPTRRGLRAYRKPYLIPAVRDAGFRQRRT